MIDHPSRRRALRALAALSLGGAAPSVLARSRAPLETPSVLPPPLRVSASAPARELALSLAAQAPRVSPHALLLATEALTRARAGQRLPGADPRVLAVIDFSLPSTDKRLWVFDLFNHALLFEEWVAHGRNSGDNLTQHFSNRLNSYMSSLGAYQAGEVYTGRNGYSLRLHGLEPEFNDRAYERAIVIHGAPYVSADVIRAQGRLGRSLGCPAVRMPVARPLIDALADQAFLFNYYPQADWLARSALIGGRGQLAG